MTEKIIPTIKFPVNLPTNSFETWTNSNEEIDIVILPRSQTIYMVDRCHSRQSRTIR